jgi:Cdc6-like AAA superfamily ATPase
MIMDNIRRLDGKRIDDDDLARRIAMFESIVIYHRRFKELFEAIRDCHQLQNKSPNKKGLCILGDTGVGKSTLLKIYERMHPKVPGDKLKLIQGHLCKYVKVPVLRVELDSNSKPLNVASKMLEELGDPLYYKGSEKQLTARLKGYIVDCEVELIFIDELQHLIDTETQRVISKAADWLKQLLNDINLPIIFGGILGNAERIFKSNQQLDDRFPDKRKFLSFNYDNEEAIKEYRAYLKNIERQLPLPDSSHLFDPYLAEKIYYATLGSPRVLNHLLHHSLKIALRRGRDMLEEGDLEEGFKLLTLEKRPKVINPFHGKSFNLVASLASEKQTK